MENMQGRNTRENTLKSTEGMTEEQQLVKPMKNKCYTFQRSLQLYKLTIKNCFSSHTTVLSHMFLGWTLHGKKSSTETYLPPIWSRP